MHPQNPLILFLLLAIVSFSSCTKETVDQPAVDKALIENYLKDNNLQAQSLASGLYYIIQQPGTGILPLPTSTVTVTYKGSLLSGTVFDQGSFYTSRLNNLIVGWQQGIPLIAAGGKIKLIIPSALAYGDRATGSIPANSVLIFDITLHYFSN